MGTSKYCKCLKENYEYLFKNYQDIFGHKYNNNIPFPMLKKNITLSLSLIILKSQIYNWKPN